MQDLTPSLPSLLIGSGKVHDSFRRVYPAVVPGGWPKESDLFEGVR